MKYLNFRIVEPLIKDDKIMGGWFVLGQRSTDLNWSMLHDAASFEAAKEYVRGIRISDNQFVYGPYGCTINI